MAKTAVSQWSATRASNSDIDGINIAESCPASNINDAIREIMVQVKEQLGGVNYKGADLASATTVDLSTATGNVIDVTGTTTITGLGTVAAGQVFVLQFDGILTFTHNGTSLILPGAANITTAAGDIAVVVSEGSGNWRCVSYQRAGGVPSFITPWVTYTPTFTGFGTAASVSMWWRRVGDSLDIRGHFTTGTTTATEARISFPSSLATDATKVDAIQQVHGGYMAQTGASTAYIIPLIESNIGYLTFGIQNATSAGLTKETGSGAFSNSRKYSIAAYGIPISGW